MEYSRRCLISLSTKVHHRAAGSHEVDTANERKIPDTAALPDRDTEVLRSRRDGSLQRIAAGTVRMRG